MALLTVHTPFNIDLQFSLAPFHKRVLAWLIDFAFMVSYSYLVVYLINDTVFDFDRSQLDKTPIGKWILLFFLQTMPVMLYQLLFELFCNGQSPGKKIIGLQVRNTEGAAATLSQYVLRWMFFVPNFIIPVAVAFSHPFELFGVLVSVAIVLLPAVICIAVTAKSQRLGDLAAATAVVDVKHKANINDTIYIEIEHDKYVPLYPQVLQLSDKDINGIRNLLNSKSSKERDNYMLRVAYRIEEVLKIKMNGDPHEFLQTLLMDYNYLMQSK